MMKHICTIAACVLSSCFGLSAQTIDFAARVSFHYEEATLQYVLDDLTARYGVKFSYSRQIIPMHRTVTASAKRMPFADALELLFSETPIVYGFIADQLVLSIDNTRIWGDSGDGGLDHDDSIAGLDHAEMHRTPRPTTTLASLSPRTPSFRIPQREDQIAVPGPQFIIDDRERRMSSAERESSIFNFQATLIPPLTVRTSDAEAPLHLSMNLLWGVNHSVAGLELGGLANITRHDMSGAQFAGLVNAVQKNASGFQAAGILNWVGDSTYGLQTAGVVNLAPQGGEMVQIGGVANISGRRVLAQIAGVANVADEVNGSQIGLVNVGRKVTGLQLGLINVSDTISGVPIGLVSVVRRGYNSVEVAAEDAIHANFNARLGVRGFYNILHVGANEHADTWSLGYGLGTSFRTGRRSFLQLEVMSRHVNEDETWTNDLNLLNQVKLIWDIGIGSRFRIALGPTFNVAVSQIYHADTDTYGTQIPNYTFYNKTFYRSGKDPVNVKYWAGFHAGIRLNSKEEPKPPRRFIE